MEIDVMTGGGAWRDMAALAGATEAAGFSGMVFTEASQTPWMAMAAAATAAPTLTFSTGVAVAFPRSPMVSAQLAWELAANTGGRFRLGLGSQVRAHVQRRYSADFEPPGPRMRDYVQAVRACFAAFAGTAPLDHHGPYYQLTFLPPFFRPARIDGPPPPVDVSAVGPYMLRMAGELADGVHVHPLHSPLYLERSLRPTLSAGATAGGRTLSDLTLIVPAFTIVGDTEEERAPLRRYVRQQIGFYGSTPNYAQQFELVGRPELSRLFNERMRAGDVAAMVDLVDDELLAHFSVTAAWNELADALVDRYRGVADRIVLYCVEESLRHDPGAMERWAGVAKRVREG